jgi:hypothetical protein
MFANDNHKEYSVYTGEKGHIIINGRITVPEWIEVSKMDTNLIKDYQADLLICQNIENIFKHNEYKLQVIGGSWCGDTKSEFPKLFKILNVCNIKENKFELFGVDRDKIIQIEKYNEINISKVPTLIVLKNEIEIGRIEEFPESSWEKDLLIILGD